MEASGEAGNITHSQNQRRYDGSVQQWPVIALMTADEKIEYPFPIGSKTMLSMRTIT